MEGTSNGRAANRHTQNSTGLSQADHKAHTPPSRHCTVVLIPYQHKTSVPLAALQALHTLLSWFELWLFGLRASLHNINTESDNKNLH